MVILKSARISVLPVFITMLFVFAGGASAADPAKEILPSTYTYKSIAASDVTSWLNRLDYLLTNVVVQNSDGSWGGGYAKLEPGSICTGSHPLIRETAHAVVMYAKAYSATKKTEYKDKALKGLDWLLSEQLSSGGFNWYCTNAGGAHLYETGLAGRALIEGYKIFGDTRYLEASEKAYEWEKSQGPYDGNANYNGFPIMHMVKHYQFTGDTRMLDEAVVFAKHMINGDPSSYQTANGYWSDDHNQIYYYHMLMTRSLILLYDAMPADHPDRQTISKAMYLAVNYLITHQKSDGSVYINPGTPTAPDEDEDYISDALTETKLPLKNVLNGLIQYQFSRPYTGTQSGGYPSSMEWREAFEQKPVVAGYLLAYVGTSSDTTPPSQIKDLKAGNPSSKSVKLIWTAPGDDGNTGTASQYDIRYSTAKISASNWDSAAQAAGEQPPKPAGQMETFTVTGLTPQTKYYFAMKTGDEVPNWSGISNVPNATTLKTGKNPNDCVSCALCKRLKIWKSICAMILDVCTGRGEPVSYCTEQAQFCQNRVDAMIARCSVTSCEGTCVF